MISKMTYEQSLEYLNGLLKFGIKFGLERITALCDVFGNPQRQLRVIHVGGTNGKGSTAAFVSSILREAGYITGLYLSPYVRDLRERIQVDGEMIPPEDFASIISEIRPVAERIGGTDMGPVTEFEVKTMAAYLYLTRRKVDFAVLEVGMGGRFDATNLVEPLVAVITNISLDHTERLGNTIEKIAFEKAGIVKTGAVLVTAVEDEGAWRVILDRCREEGAETWRVVSEQARKPCSPSADMHVWYSSSGAEFSLRRNGLEVGGLRPGLVGKFQHANAATAVAAIMALEKYEVHIPPRAIFAGVSNAHLPGRLEVLRERPMLIIDGAHNPDAAGSLATAVKESFDYDKLILVIGMLSTHSAGGVLSHLAPLASTIIATQSQWDKALPASEMAAQARGFNQSVEQIDRVSEAVSRALDLASENDLILVTGSFYTIGEVVV